MSTLIKVKQIDATELSAFVAGQTGGYITSGTFPTDVVRTTGSQDIEGQKLFYANDSYQSINTINRSLRAYNNRMSVDWSGRYLGNFNGQAVVAWDECNLYPPPGLTPSLNWSDKTLLGSWTSQTPVGASEIANKSYVDAAFSGGGGYITASYGATGFIKTKGNVQELSGSLTVRGGTFPLVVNILDDTNDIFIVGYNDGDDTVLRVSPELITVSAPMTAFRYNGFSLTNAAGAVQGEIATEYFVTGRYYPRTNPSGYITTGTIPASVARTNAANTFSTGTQTMSGLYVAASSSSPAAIPNRGISLGNNYYIWGDTSINQISFGSSSIAFSVNYDGSCHAYGALTSDGLLTANGVQSGGTSNFTDVNLTTFLGLYDSGAPGSGGSGRSGLYAETGELFAFDQAGNTTQISPHADDSPAPKELDEDTSAAIPIVIKHANPYVGTEEWIHLSALAKAVEKLTGEQFVFSRELPPEKKRDWEADQAEAAARRLEEVAKFEAEKAKVEERILQIREEKILGKIPEDEPEPSLPILPPAPIQREKPESPISQESKAMQSLN